MNTMRESIRTRTMRRVVAVYWLRKVLNMVTLKFGLLVLTALAFGSLVHVAAVFENMPALSNIGAVTLFALSAFLATGILVQFVIVAAGAVSLWLARDLITVLRTPTVKLSHA